MLESQKKTLSEYPWNKLSIGVTENGEPKTWLRVPWDSPSIAYRMRLPDVYIAKEDLQNPKIMQEIKKHKIIGVYIEVKLDDYSFLSELAEVEDLYIKDFDGTADLGFLKAYTKCQMLRFEKSKLKDFSFIPKARNSARLKQEGAPKPFSYVCIEDCEVENVGVIGEENCFFREFIIINPKERNERERWSGIQARTKKYCELVPKGGRTDD